MSQRKSTTHLVAYREDEYGVLPTIVEGDGRRLVFNDETLSADRGRVKSGATTSGNLGDRSPGKGTPDKFVTGGELTVEFDPANHTLIFDALFGGHTKTLVSGHYEHVFTPGAVPSWSLEKWFADNATGEVLLGMKLDSINFSMGPSGPLLVKGTWHGAGPSDDNPTDAPLDSAPTFNKSITFGLARPNVTIEEGGVPLGSVSQLDFTLSNGLDTEHYTVGNGGKRASCEEDLFIVSGKLAAFFDSNALLTKALNETESSFDIVIQNGTGAGTAGNEKLTQKYYGVQFDYSTPKAQGKGVMVDLTFVAEGDATHHPAEFTLLNMIPTY